MGLWIKFFYRRTTIEIFNISDSSRKQKKEKKELHNSLTLEIKEQIHFIKCLDFTGVLDLITEEILIGPLICISYVKDSRNSNYKIVKREMQSRIK